LSMKTLSKPPLVDLTWEELWGLVVCLGLDLFEYLLPAVAAPLVRGLLDLAGAVFCVVFFRWVGFLSLLELIPGLDVLPLFTVTWLVWYLLNRRGDRLGIQYELERWR